MGCEQPLQPIHLAYQTLLLPRSWSFVLRNLIAQGRNSLMAEKLDLQRALAGSLICHDLDTLLPDHSESLLYYGYCLSSPNL